MTKASSAWVNATEMAKAFGKRPNDWSSLPSSQNFMEVLEATRKSCRSDLLRTENGKGTWMHEDVALEFARWLGNQSTIDFTSTMCEVINLTSDELVKVVYGNNRGTWMHEDVSLGLIILATFWGIFIDGQLK